MSELLGWWLLVEALGVASLPLTITVFSRLPDRGWSATKALALLAVGWLVWFPLTIISALPFSRAWISGTMVVFALANVAMLRAPSVRLALSKFIRTQRGYIVASEIVFASAFGLMAWVRSFTPAVVDTEKFMDVAFLSSIWRAPHLPPPDPWLSGETINYYYFGHYLMALLAKALGTQPGMAFNLAIALIFALTAVVVFGLATNIVAAIQRTREASLLRYIPAGLASAVFVLIAGNLAGAQQWWRQATQFASGAGAQLANPWAFWLRRDLWMRYDWWAPSRVVGAGATINEFPAFSFILSDLHAHLLALPFVALAILVALNLLLGEGEGLAAFGAPRWRFLALGVLALCLGALFAINGWDFPTYLGLALLALVVQQWLAHQRRFSWLLALDVFSVVIFLGGLAVALYLPFYRGFSSPSQGVGVVPGDVRSPIGDVFSIYGLFVFILISYGVLLGARALADVLAQRAASSDGEPLPDRGLGRLLAGGVIVASLLLLALLTVLTLGVGGWTLIWTLLLTGGFAALALYSLGVWGGGADAREDRPVSSASRATAFLFALGSLAALLVCACEIVYLRDVFGGGALFRMNTVFKLYYQAWLIAGVAAGPALYLLVVAAVKAITGALGTTAAGTTSAEDITANQGRLVSWGAVGGVALWSAALVALIAASFVYPVLATSARTMNLTSPRTLDGIAYMAHDSPTTFADCRQVDGGSNSGDDAAIRWLNAHIEGSPVIVEAPGAEYSHCSRISAFTGLPTVMGWGGHEVQWRVNWLAQPGHEATINQRLDAVNQIYTAAEQSTVMGLLRRYHVRLLYVGAAERQTYAGVDLDRYASYLTVVYQHAGVTIYATEGGS
jgi:YYY domain-containing protein